jgi:glycosyltransferase involved in cell wall biosynthesis
MDKPITKIETFVSTVLILNYSNVNSAAEYLESLQQYLEQCFSDYEIIIIDQDTPLFPVLNKKEILKSIPSIRWIKLAFPVETDVALNVGIENSIGDYVVFLRASVDPIDIISDMVKQCSQGSDVIVGVAEQERTIGYKFIRKLSNKLLHAINYHIPKNATPVRCLSRKAINTILTTGKVNHQFFIKIANTGYPTQNFEYQLLKNNHLKKRTLVSGIKQSLHLMIFNSTKPLRWISMLGALGSLSAFVFAIYSVVINLIKDDVVEGWTSMIFIVSFLFMVLFIILAFLGEYLSRLLNEVGNQKKYFISNEETSAVMLETDRYNVLQQS